MPQLKSSQATMTDARNNPGIYGNIMSPLVEIPFKRPNDEKALSGVQTFTRVSTATYIDTLDGLVKTAAIDTPRFEKMSDGGTGILMEGSSTNLVLNSNAYNISIVAAGTYTTSLTTGIAPTGISSSFYNYNQTSNSYGYVYQSILPTLFTNTSSGSQHTFSIFIRVNSGSSDISLDIRGSSPTGGFKYFGISSIVPLDGGWHRVSSTFTLDLPDYTAFQFGISASGVSNYDIWGAQLEALPFATSYIPTSGVAATRVLDKLSIPFAGNAPRVGLSYKNPITVVFDVDLHKWNSVNQTLISSSLNYDYLFRQFSNAIYMYYGQNIVTLPSVSSSTGTHRLAVSISADKTSIFGYLDGVSGALGSSSSDSTGTPSNIFLGSQSNIYSMYGHIRNFRIYDRALTPREIQAS